jgi:hypothetical protein
MRYGLLLGTVFVLSMSLLAVGGTVSGVGDSIIIGNITAAPGQNQVSVPVYFVTYGEVTHYNLPLAIESAGDIQFVGQEVGAALDNWDDHWQGLKNHNMQAVEMGFSDLGGEDNAGLNTNGRRVEAFKLQLAIRPDARVQTATINARTDERSGPPVFGYEDGVTAAEPVIVGGAITLSAGGSDPLPLPTAVSLSQNYPNPFNPTTEIEYGLPDAREAKLTIFNILGQTVRNLVSERQEAGYHKVVWDGCDNTGRQVPSGAYLYKLEAGDFSQSMKMVLLK